LAGLWQVKDFTTMKRYSAKELAERKAAQNKIHSQKRLAERRCVTHHQVRHIAAPRPRRKKLNGRIKAARPSAWDHQAPAMGYGDHEQERSDNANRLLREKMILPCQREASPIIATLAARETPDGVPRGRGGSTWETRLTERRGRYG
jgi:hypothetical protein